jgi:hypothetical protein
MALLRVAARQAPRMGAHHLAFTQLGAMFEDQVGHCSFKPDVKAGFFGLDQFVFQDFLSKSLSENRSFVFSDITTNKKCSPPKLLE